MRAPVVLRLLAGACALAVAVLSSAPAGARRAPPLPAHAAPLIEVQAMGTTALAATPAMRERMRDRVSQHLRALVEGRALTSPRGYLVDGSVDGLDVVVKADAVEISCSVRLILSARRSGAMLVTTTGQATLRDPRRALKPATLTRLELEALDGAVQAASDELVNHFALRGAT